MLLHRNIFISTRTHRRTLKTTKNCIIHIKFTNSLSKYECNIWFCEFDNSNSVADLYHGISPWNASNYFWCGSGEFWMQSMPLQLLYHANLMWVQRWCFLIPLFSFLFLIQIWMHTRMLCCSITTIPTYLYHTSIGTRIRSAIDQTTWHVWILLETFKNRGEVESFRFRILCSNGSSRAVLLNFQMANNQSHWSLHISDDLDIGQWVATI